MRTEKDALGELDLPEHVYYGIQSYRASQNFSISGTQVHPELIKSYLRLKKAAAIANAKSGALDEKLKKAITRAIDELLENEDLSHFIIDAYQAGAGTSQNMNCNEVIANISNKLLGKPLGSYSPVHPNDHVNMSQSTNDTYPTAMRLALLVTSKDLIAELEKLSESFDRKSKMFDRILKAARTHLQDAVPIRLGQELGAYRDCLRQCAKVILESQDYLRELGIGGSAAGTGINVPKGFRKAILEELKKLFRDDHLSVSKNLCFAMQSQMPVMIYSNALRTTALELTRISNDLRLLSSGPSTGLSEIFLPATQPGSSIMPGKVNPSILEMTNQVLFKVLGNDTGIAYAMQAGQLELNVMMPVMAQMALESTHILTQALKTLRTLCIDGIAANEKKCREYLEHTSQIVTALNPLIGYEKAAELAKEAVRTEKSILALVREKNLLSDAKIKEILNPLKLTEPER